VSAQQVADPHRYGLVEFDDDGVPIGNQEKPAGPRSSGTLVSEAYLRQGRLHVSRFGRGFAWPDTGTVDSFVAASEFVRVVEERQALKIGCPEEVAFREGYIDRAQLGRLAAERKRTGSDHGAYLQRPAGSA
jgi:glucose-1-phosphate thymidylyltransferase